MFLKKMFIVLGLSILIQGQKHLIENEDETLIEFIKMLGSFGFEINSRGSEEKTLAFRAAEAGNLEIIKALAKQGADLNLEGGFYEMTPLQAAAKNGHCDIVKFLVHQGVNVNAVDGEGKSALFRASEEEESECLEILLNSGADPYVRGTDGMTIMHIAAENGNSDMIKQLKKYNKLINANDNDNNTPLYLAAYKHHIESVRDLINIGAKITQNVMWGAVSGGDEDIVKYLVGKGGNVNSRFGLYNDTILMKAAIHDYKDITEFLLDNGAKLEARNSKGFTALHWATSWDQVSTTELLINRNADINSKDNEGKTPLDLAGPQTKQLLRERTKA